MITDQSGRLTYVNPAWILTYGYKNEEAIGQTPRILRSNRKTMNFTKIYGRPFSIQRLAFGVAK